MALIRLQKFLSLAGVCSRRHGEDLIVGGRVTINGMTASRLGSMVDPENDHVEVDGTPVAIEKNLVYIAMNKPKGYVTSCCQPDDLIVLDLLNINERVFPVGRLDKDSTGLLILTNDGRIHHRLSHPSFDHEKEYEVTVKAPITDGALKSLEKGITLMGKKTRPAGILRLSSNRFRMVLKEGRNRQIRRMVQKVGNEVTGLKRIRIASLKLGRLREGAWRHLNENERRSLLQNIFDEG
jgi:pseudouridine synthase